MRLVALIAMIAGAIMFSSATPEPACAFEFCSGLKPIKPDKLNWPPRCIEICLQCRDVGRDAFCDADSDPDTFGDTDCEWVWVCCC